ncbi:AI-2E family transporter [Bacillus carboniphilus]|uniref:AI-2E family transporter n=1 Tax=Bacillus carboniphilus TaxID=86663 RepID=A0ABY9JXG2_9BACI|nr:AI-2E family transporter [Bacillus carboniphilus]WLR44035.1 AI-2E family transporter [Bacillus carboniphilus]
MENKYVQILFKLIIVLLILIIGYMLSQLYFLWGPVVIIVRAIITPLIISLFITYLLHPIVEKLKSTGFPRVVSILLIYSLFFGGIGFLVFKGYPIMMKQIKEFSENIPAITKAYQQMLDELYDQTSKLPGDVYERVVIHLKKSEEWLGNTVEKLLLNYREIANHLILIAIVPFLVFYMLKDIDKMKKATWYITPPKWRKEGKQFLYYIDESLGAYIRGQLLVCLIIGSLSIISLMLFRIPYSLLLGLIIGITNIIPYFGPVFGAVPAIIIAATISMEKVFVVVVIIIALQFIEGNILGPLIVGKSLHIHPVVIIFALIAGGELAGIIGLIVAVPAVAVLRVVIIHTLKLKQDH